MKLPDMFHPKTDKPVCMDCRFVLRYFVPGTNLIHTMECLHEHSLIDYDLYTGRANYRSCIQMRETHNSYFCGCDARLFKPKTPPSPIDTTVWAVKPKPSFISRVIKYINTGYFS